MLQTTQEKHIKSLKEKKDNHWFPFTNSTFLTLIESVGISIAFTVRATPLLRWNIGTGTFSWGMVMGGFVWMRIWAIVASEQSPFDPTASFVLLNPMYSPADAIIISYLSLIFLAVVIFYKMRDNITFFVVGKDIESSKRGKSHFQLKPSRNSKYAVLSAFCKMLKKAWFIQVITEPLILKIIGFGLLYVSSLYYLGWFLIISSVFYCFDEYNYHSADGRLLLIQRDAQNKGESIMDRHKLFDEASGEDSIYS